MTQLSENQTNIKRISEETIQEIRGLNLKEFAEAMGDQLTRSGQWYMTYKNGGERRPSVGIQPLRRFWCDFTRHNVSGKDAISYYAYRTYNDIQLEGKRFAEACIAVCDIAGIPLKYADGSTLAPTRERRVTHSTYVDKKDDVQDIKGDDLWLDYYYRHLLDQLSLDDEHMRHMVDVRGIPYPEVLARGYRSVTDNPKTRYMITKQLINTTQAYPEGVPGFALMQRRDKSTYWLLIGRGGFLIPFRNVYNQIVGFQLRVDDPRRIRVPQGYSVRLFNHEVEILEKADEKVVWKGTRDQFPVTLARGEAVLIEDAKYVWISTSTDVERGIIQGARIGHPTPAPYHVAVPFSVLKTWTPGDFLPDIMDLSKTEIWWGEGALKGDIASNHTEAIHLQAAGIKNFRQLIEPTLQLNPKRVVLAFDSDTQVKDDLQKVFLECAKEAHKLLTPLGIELFWVGWDPNEAKGIDDLALLLRRPHYYPLNGVEYYEL